VPLVSLNTALRQSRELKNERTTKIKAGVLKRMEQKRIAFDNEELLASVIAN
jgi:hypothetical protein